MIHDPFHHDSNWNTGQLLCCYDDEWVMWPFLPSQKISEPTLLKTYKSSRFLIVFSLGVLGWIRKSFAKPYTFVSVYWPAWKSVSQLTLVLYLLSLSVGENMQLVISVDMHVNEFSSVFYGYCSQYYFLHKYNTKLYNRVKEME